MKPSNPFAGHSVPSSLDRSLRIFIAGASSRRHQIAETIKSLLEHGHYGYDWTADPAWTGLDYCPATIARRDLVELQLADAVIWDLDKIDISHGAPYEVGYAAALGKPIVVLWRSNPCPNLIYAWLHMQVHSLDAAIEDIERVVLLGETQRRRNVEGVEHRVSTLESTVLGLKLQKFGIITEAERKEHFAPKSDEVVIPPGGVYF